MKRILYIPTLCLALCVGVIFSSTFPPKFTVNASIATEGWEENEKMLYSNGWPIDKLENEDGSFYITYYDLDIERAVLTKIDERGDSVWEDDVVFPPESVPSKMIQDINGGLFFVYVLGSGDEENEDYYVYAQRVNSNGVVQWGENGIAICINEGRNVGISAVEDGDGGFIVTWLLDGNMEVGGNYGVYAQRVNSEGTVLWQENGLNITDVDTYRKGEPVVVSDGDETVIITWVSQFSGGGTDPYIFSRKINNSGTMLWNVSASLEPNMYSYDYTIYPISDGDNGVVIAWANAEGFLMQHLDEDGDRLWTDNGKLVVQAVDQDPGLESSFGMGRNLVRDSNGSFIIGWQDARNDEDGWTYDTYAQKIDKDGNVLWGVSGLPISITPLQDQGSLSISIDDSDGVFFAWLDFRDDPEIYSVGKIYMQYITNEGEALLSENGLKLSDSEISSPLWIFLLGDFSSGIIVAWTQSPFAGSFPVYAKSFVLLNQIKGVVSNLEISDIDGNSIKENSTNGLNSSSETVYIKDAGTGLLLSDVVVDLTNDREWSSVSGASDLSLKKAYIKGIESAEGVSGSHSLYVPRGTMDANVVICPSATNLDTVHESCTGAIIKDVSDNDTSVVSIDGQSYWRVEGLSGTGGLSVLGVTDDSGEEDQDQPRSTYIALVEDELEEDDEVSVYEETFVNEGNIVNDKKLDSVDNSNEEKNTKSIWKYSLLLLLIPVIYVIRKRSK